MKSLSAPVRGAIFSLVGAILFSTKAIFVKLAYHYDVDSISLLTLRMVFSLPFFLLIGWWSFRNEPSKILIVRSNKLKLIALGLSGFYLASYLDLEGLRYIDASLERVILFMYPTIVVLISVLWYGQKIHLPQAIAIGITYAGIVTAFSGNMMMSSSPKIVLGSILVSASAISYAIYLVGSQGMLAKLGTRSYNSITMTMATAAILIHQILINQTDMGGFLLPVYVYGFLIASISTVLPSFMIMEGIRLIGANNSSIIGSVGPISTILMAYLLLDERLNLIQWIGSLIVIGGVVFLIVQNSRLLKRKK